MHTVRKCSLANKRKHVHGVETEEKNAFGVDNTNLYFRLFVEMSTTNSINFYSLKMHIFLFAEHIRVGFAEWLQRETH